MNSGEIARNVVKQAAVVTVTVNFVGDGPATGLL
jgi:hypothetical protein